MTSKEITDEELRYPTEALRRIPSFAKLDEEASFWDTHNFTEWMGVGVQLIEVMVKGDSAKRLTVRLDQEGRRELTRRAREL